MREALRVVRSVQLGRPVAMLTAPRFLAPCLRGSSILYSLVSTTLNGFNVPVPERE
jgi:hypothetical protein